MGVFEVQGHRRARPGQRQGRRRDDMLFDKSGKIIGLIVGVGGFLGIGEKNVAIDMGAFQVVPASTGSTGGAGQERRSRDNDPTNVKLKVSWTKDQLKSCAGLPVLQGRRRARRRHAHRRPAWRRDPRPVHGALAREASVSSVSRAYQSVALANVVIPSQVGRSGSAAMPVRPLASLVGPPHFGSRAVTIHRIRDRLCGRRATVTWNSRPARLASRARACMTRSFLHNS